MSKAFVTYAKKNLVLMIKNISKSEIIVVTEIIVIRGTARNVCNLRYKTAKEIILMVEKGIRGGICHAIQR